MDEVGRKIRFDEILAEFVGMAQRQWALLAIYVAAVAVIDTVITLTFPASAANFASGLISLGAGFAFDVTVMRREGLVSPDAGPPSFGSYFGASFLAGLGIILGFICLIVPGFFLLARWSVSSQFVIGEGMSASHALEASRDATRASVWTIAGFYFAALVAGLAAIVGAAAVFELLRASTGSLIAEFGEQLVGAAFQGLGLVVAIALFRLLRGQTGELIDVFA